MYELSLIKEVDLEEVCEKIELAIKKLAVRFDQEVTDEPSKVDIFYETYQYLLLKMHKNTKEKLITVAKVSKYPMMYNIYKT